MSASKALRIGQHVRWNWGNGEGCGQVTERFERRVERTLKGSKITRNGSEEEPADQAR